MFLFFPFSSLWPLLKVLSSHLEGGREYTHSIPAVELEARQVFKIFFNDTVSREEHKTIFSGLRISEMTFSYQSHFPGFFLSPESHLIGFFKSYKMALWIENKGPPCFLLLWGYRQLLGQQQYKRQLDAVVHVLAVIDDLAVVDVLAVVDICWKAPVLLWTGAWPIPAYDKPKLARPR